MYYPIYSNGVTINDLHFISVSFAPIQLEHQVGSVQIKVKPTLCSPELEQDHEKRPNTLEREEKINRTMGYLQLHTVLY